MIVAKVDEPVPQSGETVGEFMKRTGYDKLAEQRAARYPIRSSAFDHPGALGAAYGATAFGPGRASGTPIVISADPPNELDQLVRQALNEGSFEVKPGGSDHPFNDVLDKKESDK